MLDSLVDINNQIHPVLDLNTYMLRIIQLQSCINAIDLFTPIIFNKCCSCDDKLIVLSVK